VNFAREGFPFMAAAALLAAVGFGLALSRRSFTLWLVALLLLVVALWIAYFFRDPERTGERGDRLVLAPADGKVVMMTEVDEPTFLHGRAMRVSIFMNVFSVHVNRYPISGTVKHVHYAPGKFLNAVAEESSLSNEMRSVGIESGTNRVLVRQIAGLIARRIVTYSREGDRAVQGERFGIIRFGSRVDVFVPADSKLRVQLGQQATAGSTVLAELAQP
jgi:phosphatidylserine decarboxylase